MFNTLVESTCRHLSPLAAYIRKHPPPHCRIRPGDIGDQDEQLIAESCWWWMFFWVLGTALSCGRRSRSLNTCRRILKKRRIAFTRCWKRTSTRFFFDQDNQLSSGSEEAHQKFMTFRSHATNFTNVTQKFLTQILTDLGSDTGLGQRFSQSST